MSALLSGIALVITAINTRKINEVRTATNGMSATINKLTGDARYAEGVTQGEDNPRPRRK